MSAIASVPAKREPIPAESFHYVLRKIAGGLSIRAACRELKRRGDRAPSPQAFLVWCDKSPERSEQYSRAKARGIEILTDEMHHLLDTAGDGCKDPAMFNARVAKAKACVWARMWAASKLRHKVYGDKLQHDHSGSVSITVVTGLPELPVARMLDDDGPRPGVLTYQIGDAVESGDAGEAVDSADSAEPSSIGYASARLLDE